RLAGCKGPKGCVRVRELPRSGAGKVLRAGLRHWAGRTRSVQSPAVIYDKDADLAKLDGKTVAVLGYGSQGHAHALNLKDSGVDVVVGLRAGSSSVEKAKGDGLDVLGVADAASRGDIVMVLLPDEKQAEVWEAEIADGFGPGN